MKTIRNILIICALICCFVSCKKVVDMTLMQKTLFENADIREIEIGDAWQVTLVADSVTFVELSYSAYLEPYLKAKMEGTKLEIGFVGKVYAESGSVFHATVHAKQLEKLEANEAALVKCEGVFPFQSQKLELHLSDASQCNGLAFSGTTCEVKLEDASLLTGFIHYGSVFNSVLEDASQFNGEVFASQWIEIYLCDASRFVSKGTATEIAHIHLNDASLINMAEIQIGTMEVEMYSGSEATVQVTDLIKGTLKEASTLFYKGHPQIDVECSDDSRLIPF